jgi:hypothetical protein
MLADFRPRHVVLAYPPLYLFEHDSDALSSFSSLYFLFFLLLLFFFNSLSFVNQTIPT